VRKVYGSPLEAVLLPPKPNKENTTSTATAANTYSHQNQPSGDFSGRFFLFPNLHHHAEGLKQFRKFDDLIFFRGADLEFNLFVNILICRFDVYFDI
jgi:hypothetical protein